MKLYQTTGFPVPVSDMKSRWSGALAAASKDRVAMKKEGLTDIETHEVDVPISKVDLLAWLNSNSVTV